MNSKLLAAHPVWRNSLPIPNPSPTVQNLHGGVPDLPGGKICLKPALGKKRSSAGSCSVSSRSGEKNFGQRLKRGEHRCRNWRNQADPACPNSRSDCFWYTKPDDAIGYAKFRSRSHHAVIRVYDAADNVIETHEHAGA
jgi:hypothetical protein